MSEHEPHGVDHGAADDSPETGDALPIVSGRSGSRRATRRRSGCLPVLLVLVVLAAGGYFLVRSIDVSNPFEGGPEDFAGPGTGAVAFTVAAGDTAATMGQNLEDLGVVASREAYIEAATADPESRSIREGVYRLQKEMKASEAIDLLVTGATRGTSFTFTAGKWTEEVVDLLVKDTGISRRRFDAALDDPGSLGLPDDAEGNTEGYLAPGSYTFFPDDDAATILATMVERTLQGMEEAGFAGAAEDLGYTEHELLTVASLVQAEGSLLDQQGKGKIARVIYNRLENPTAETVGLLQLDATVDYARGERVARLTDEQVAEAADSPYSTYANPGLPPTPIATPSESALRAAVKPAGGEFLYYATVNLESGETKFVETYDEFLGLRAELDDYCATQSDRC